MKKLKSTRYSLFVYIAILALVAGLYFLIKNNLNKTVEVEKQPITQVEKEKPTPKLIDKSLFEEKISNEPNEYTTIEFFYPQFKNASAEFNNKIESFVMERIDSHKKSSEENWKARYENRSPGDKITEFPKDDEKFSFDGSWRPVQANAEFISFILAESGYTGGAHGYTNLTSFNYDVVNKKEITLADLFPTNPDYLKTISEFSRNNIIMQLKKEITIDGFTKDWIDQGTEPVEENFAIFTFTPDSIILNFAEYQVVSRVMGSLTVTMPRK